MLQKFIYTIPRESEYKIDTLNIMRKFFYNCHLIDLNYLRIQNIYVILVVKD